MLAIQQQSAPLSLRAALQLAAAGPSRMPCKRARLESKPITIPQNNPPTIPLIPVVPALNTPWLFYRHELKDRDWTAGSYKSLGQADTVPAFWGLIDNPAHQVDKNFYFLMRAGHAPLWEAPENIDGGSLAFNLHRGNWQAFWLLAAQLLVGETICPASEEVVGLSISPKSGVIIIKLWIRNMQAMPALISSLNPALLKLCPNYNIKIHRE